ncbi:hypothetical protein KUTG_05596 [Kutzneria sp. 744]|nr:hypothetical protein KUTG_05596 [Kutzneria sp. 744]
MEQIADTFHTSRATAYRALAKQGDVALIVYRGKDVAGVDDDGRPYGETSQAEAVQLDADRKYWPLANAKKNALKAIVYVVNGKVKRIRAVDPNGKWIPTPTGTPPPPTGTSPSPHR